MSGERKRGPILKRIAVWTAGVVLVPMWYIASAPVVSCSVGYSRLGSKPAVLRALNAFYSPLMLLRQHPEVPGSTEFDVYCRWYQQQHEEFFDVEYRTYPISQAPQPEDLLARPDR